MPDLSAAAWTIGLREGGFFLIILIVLFFYRRDWTAVNEYWKQQNQITTQIVKESTTAMMDIASALREQVTVTHGLKRIMESTSACPMRDDQDRDEFLSRRRP